MKTRVGQMTTNLKERTQDMRMEKIERENAELKHENKLLQTQAEEDRESRERVLSLLDRVDVTPRKKRRGGLRVLIFAGAAYVLGARAGRERYEQIRRWWDQMLQRAPVGGMKERASEFGQTVERAQGGTASDPVEPA